MAQPKDFSTYTPNEERMKEVDSLIARGASSLQLAFKAMVALILVSLDECKGDDGKAPEGALARIKEVFRIKGWTERGGNAKSIVTPAFWLANALHRKTASAAMSFIWEDFLAEGDGREGSVVRGPLYTAGRLNALMGKLAAKGDDSPCEVTAQGLLVNGKPWWTYTITQLKAINQRGDVDPKAAATLNRILGVPGNEKRRGELAAVVKSLREDNEKIRSESLEELATRIEEFIEELRADMEVTLAEAQVQAAEAKRIEAEQRRLGVKAGVKPSVSREADPANAAAEAEEETVG